MQSLGDILRKAVLETDGVSIDSFKEKVRALYNDYFSHWDDALELPEKKRGLENPWRKEVGSILQHYYDRELSRTALETARIYEDRHDTFNKQLTEYGEKIEDIEKYLKEHKKAYEDAKKRKMLCTELEAYEIKIGQYSKVNTDWPVKESKLADIQTKLPALENKLLSFKEERNVAEAAEQSKSLREQFKRVDGKKDELDKEQQKLAKIRKITSEELAELNKASQAILVCEAQISAGKISIKFNARKDMTLTVQKDLDEKSEQAISSGGPLEIEAGGILNLDHEDWHLEITSGDGSITDVLSHHKDARTKYDALLKHHSIASVQEAEEIHSVFDDAQRAVSQAEKMLQNELGDESYDELKKKFEELGTVKTTRPLPDIIGDYKDCENELRTANKDKQGHENAIAEYKKDYTDIKTLMLLLGKNMQGQHDLQDEFDKLAPLPDGVDDVDAFISQYDSEKETLERDSKQLHDIKIDLAKLEGEAPELSVEELEKQLHEDEEKFCQHKQRGDAVRRVKKLTESLVEDMDSGIYTGLKGELEQHISFVTEKKYEEVALDGVLPEGFIRKDGKTISYDLLSTGTKDVLALSLRLAMASHFLKEAKGFIMMDDPMVDMDPKRQKKAADLLNQYAEHKQVMIFTCHPSHAELLGGNQIVL